jgi:cephalosporin hydroxylase
MNPVMQFEQQVVTNIRALGNDAALGDLAKDFMIRSGAHRYTYNFTSFGRPIIQFPQDMVAVQELVWATRPDLIIETGIAHGGSLVMSASMLALLDMCDAIESGAVFDPRASHRRVIGVDIDIRSHNRRAIEAHPMASRIEMIAGSSVAPDVIATVQQRATSFARVMVLLDSNHTHDHVLAELEAYAPLVACGCYCVVFDTSIDDVPKSMFPDRPWGPGDNPKSAVHAFLRSHSEFQIDASIHNKLLITVAPDGYLKRVL